MATAPPIDDVLQQTFGHAAFRGRQREVIEHVLGGKNGLVLFPTGEGKSLCYQLPALLLPGVTLVLSPLIALMQDQVAALRARGIAATYINSTLTRAEKDERLRAAIDGAVKLLYVTPERFRVPGFADSIHRLRVSLLVVDEAHCISQWGHDFRPDYARVGVIRNDLGRPPTLALTATATPPVQKDIRDRLGIADAPVFSTGIERPNLCLQVTEVATQDDKRDAVLERLATLRGAGIVYFALIKDLLAFETECRRRGLRPLVYHGDLSGSERREMHARFRGDADVRVLATNAFGMGIDKPDIRFILHHQMPRNLESYYQEIGRAGRDGRGSLCELYWLPEDLAIQQSFVEWANPGHDFLHAVVRTLVAWEGRHQALDVERLKAELLTKNRRDGRVDTCLNLLEAAGCIRGNLDKGTFELQRVPDAAEIRSWTDADKRRRDLLQLQTMVEYARSPTCWKDRIHSHFGFAGVAGGNCGACGRCLVLDDWLRRHDLVISASAPVRDAAPAAATARDGDAPLQRGDWVEIAGAGLGHVQQVERRGGRTRIRVEMAETLERRVFELEKVRWKKL